MKVAYIVGGLPFGGIERWLYDLCLEYKNSGLVRPQVFNISGTGELLPEYLDAGISVECTAHSKRALVTWRFDTTCKLRKALKEFAPDIIHTMHFTANYHGRLAAVGLGVPVLVHIRNTKHERRTFRRFADKALSRLTTEYLAVSKAVAETVRSDHNRAGRPVQVIYNAILPERLGHDPVDLQERYGLKHPVVVSVGRYVPQKNLDCLMRAIGLLRDGGRYVSLVMVGEGPERIKLETLRAELRLKDRVALTGFRSDVPAFLKAADIYAMPSDYEGLPIAHLEAMYCGLPSVVSEHVPSLEIAAEACLVCERTAEDIAAKIWILLSNPEMRKQMSEKALALAREYAMPKYALSLYDIYRGIIAQSMPVK
jgi:glycosyltransferase involved in cell wall biosynthesis